VTPADAARAIVEQCAPLAAERRALREALDLVLAEDVVSPIDLPPWDNSAMDGYAVRAADVAGPPPVELAVIETVPAGAFPTTPLGSGQATRIYTGAPLPENADSVIRQEDTESGDPAHVVIRNTRDAGKNVRWRGEDIRKGATVLAKGTPLGPAQLGVLASIAHERPLVHRRPRVAFLGSGDEIVDLDRRDEVLAGTKIATSNSYTLHGMIRRAGGIRGRACASIWRVRRRKRRTCWSRPPASAWASTTSCAKCWWISAARCTSGGSRCGPARPSASARSAAARGSDCPAIPSARW
jgi:molybdopterin molybdotransferase